MSEETQLMENVRFGIEVEEFLNGRLGRYVMDRARREKNESLAKLAEVNAHDSKAIQTLQNVVKRAESIERWLAEAIQEGWNAEAQIRSAEAI